MLTKKNLERRLTMHLFKKRIILDSETIKDYNGKIVMTEIDGNMIWCVDYKNNYFPRLLAQFPNEKGRKRCFGDIVSASNKIFFIPFSAASLYCLDMDEDKWTCLIDFNGLTNRIYKTNCKFMSGHIYGEYLYLMPAAFPGIVKLNFETKQYFIIDKWIDEPEVKELNDGYFRKTLLRDGKIYAPFCDTGKILILDLNTDKTTIENINNDNAGFSSVCIHSNRMYLSPRNPGKITIVDLDTNNKTKIDKEICGNEVLTEWGERIVCSPSSKGNLFVLDEDNNVVEMLNVNGGSVSSVVSGDNLIVVLSNKGTVREYSYDMRLIYENRIYLDLKNQNDENRKVVDILLESYFGSSNNPIMEDTNFDLSNFMELISII